MEISKLFCKMGLHQWDLFNSIHRLENGELVFDEGAVYTKQQTKELIQLNKPEIEKIIGIIIPLRGGSMCQFSSETAEEKAKIIMKSLKGMTIYDVKGVLEIITQNIERVANGTVYEPFGIGYQHDEHIASDIMMQTLLKATRPKRT